MRAPADRRRRRDRRVTATIAASVVGTIALVGAATVLVGVLRHQPAIVGCTVSVGSTVYRIDLDQAQNATTIAAVGSELRLPDHAVTVALAAAMQESNLHNLSYGDRDSLGLFQQRPSQGWGSAQQLLTPSYAATAFYRALTHVPDWRDLPVTVAAQRVQRSAAPDAYAKWEPRARSLAIALTGEQVAAFACRYTIARSAQPPRPYAPALARETGVTTLDTALPDAQAWTVASWLVGHASDYRISAVALLGQRWTAASGTWQHAPSRDAAIHVVQADSSTSQ